MNQKIALITGAGRAQGIGLATARALAQQGFHVIVTARTDAQAHEQASTLRAEGHSAEGYQLDLGATDEFPGLAERIQKDYGYLDVLINNASVFPDMNTGSALDAPIDDIQAAFDIN